jgi:hypothetical protein
MRSGAFQMGLACRSNLQAERWREDGACPDHRFRRWAGGEALGGAGMIGVEPPSRSLCQTRHASAKASVCNMWRILP